MNSSEKLAKILNTTPEALVDLDSKMSLFSGQQGVLDSVISQNTKAVDGALNDLGLTRSATPSQIYQALVAHFEKLDGQLYEFLGKPDLSQMSTVCGKLCEAVQQIYTPPRGLFIKKEKVASLLEKYRPDNLLEHFGCSTVSELIEKEGFASVVAGLRFAQSQEWMHKFFDEAYSDITADDFEEREVELKILDHKWLEVAEKFLAKKYHNVSHLKEYGVIFVIPIPLNIIGETTRMFTLLLHYLHEVPFYAGLIRRAMEKPDFNKNLNSLLRGDVPEGPKPQTDQIVWRIVQRYLAKDDPNDFRLAENHVNPEAEHWFRAEGDLERLSRMMGQPEGEPLSFAHWTGLDFAGDYFKNEQGQDELVSFDLIDLIMSLVKKGEVKYLYHHQEALWNKIFSEYLGRERMNELIEDNIIEGFIKL